MHSPTMAVQRMDTHETHAPHCQSFTPTGTHSHTIEPTEPTVLLMLCTQMSDMLQTLAQNQNNFLQIQQKENQDNCLFMLQLLNCLAPEPSSTRPDTIASHQPPLAATDTLFPSLITSATDKATNTDNNVMTCPIIPPTTIPPWQFW